jgi:cholesterol transport system auxiliary component
MRRPHRLALALLGGLLAVGGCLSTSRPYPAKQRFVLDASREAPLPPRAEGLLLEVPPFGEGPRLAGRELVYRTGEAEYASDFYAEFWAPPGALVADVARRWLAGSGVFGGVVQPGSALRPPLVLQGWVSELYGDYRDPAAPKAVLALHVMLLDRRGAAPRILLERDYRAEGSAAAATPEALVAAWDADLGQVLGSLEADLRTAVGP